MSHEEIIKDNFRKWNIPLPQQKYEVLVHCSTYNHERYIEAALNGFVMQKTNFPFCAIIIDDCSTDCTPDIILKYAKEYPDIIKPILLGENHMQHGKPRDPYFVEWYKSCKYLAQCEGDDYWIDPMKLQKQVDYLENNSDCGMVYTAYRIQNDITGVNTDVYSSDLIRHDDTFKWKLLEQKVMVGTCTTLIRTALWNEVKGIKDDYEGFMMGDTQTWFNAARLSGIGYIPEVTGVYRKQPSGATAIFDTKRRISFIQNGLDMHLHLAYKYGAPKETVRIIKESYGLCLISSHIVVKDYDKAQNVNREFFNNNLAIKLYILTLKVLGITKSRGLGFISRHMYHNNVR